MHNNLKFQGVVVDRIDNIAIAKTHYKTTWEEAHKAAGGLARRKGLHNSERTR